MLANHHGAPADPVGDRPRGQRPQPAGEQHQREQVASLRLRMAERDLPERDERDQAEPGGAAEGDQPEQQCERLLAGPPGLRAGRVRPGAKLEETEWPRAGRPRPEAWEREQKPAGQAERDDERRGRRRAECVAEVPADREEAHPAGALPAARVGRELRALGVVRRNPEARDDDEQKHEPVGGRGRRERDPDPGYRDSRREQPERPSAVGPRAEERLDQ
jgi:hypothetical protein